MKKLIIRILFLLGILVVWETVYILSIFPDLLFPSVRSIFAELVNGLTQDTLLTSTLKSLSLIFEGMFWGLLLALTLTGIALMNEYFYILVDNIVLFLNPIPSMAIFPLCILWFGLGRDAIIFVMIHSVLWSLLLNILAGIKSISPIYKEIGLNLELSKLKMLKDIYIPACISYIVAGAKISFARAWRTAISAELMAGVVAGNSGLGWYMTRQRYTLNIAGLLSSIIVIMLVGVVIEDLIFRALENFTVKKWGMK